MDAVGDFGREDKTPREHHLPIRRAAAPAGFGIDDADAGGTLVDIRKFLGGSGLEHFAGFFLEKVFYATREMLRAAMDSELPCAYPLSRAAGEGGTHALAWEGEGE